MFKYVGHMRKDKNHCLDGWKNQRLLKKRSTKGKIEIGKCELHPR